MPLRTAWEDTLTDVEQLIEHWERDMAGVDREARQSPVVQGDDGPKSPRVEYYLEQGSHGGRVNLRANVPGSRVDWYVLSITPQGTIERYTSIESGEVFQLDDLGRVIIEDA